MSSVDEIDPFEGSDDESTSYQTSSAFISRLKHTNTSNTSTNALKPPLKPVNSVPPTFAIAGLSFGGDDDEDNENDMNDSNPSIHEKLEPAIDTSRIMGVLDPTSSLQNVEAQQALKSSHVATAEDIEKEMQQQRLLQQVLRSSSTSTQASVSAAAAGAANSADVTGILDWDNVVKSMEENSKLKEQIYIDKNATIGSNYSPPATNVNELELSDSESDSEILAIIDQSTHLTDSQKNRTREEQANRRTENNAFSRQLLSDILPNFPLPDHLFSLYFPQSDYVTSLTPSLVRQIRLKDHVVLKPPIGVSPFSDICKPVKSWETFSFPIQLTNLLTSLSYANPFPVQSHVLPLIMSGSDVLCCAKTGSGKSLSFILPALRYVLENKERQFSSRSAASYHFKVLPDLVDNPDTDPVPPPPPHPRYKPIRTVYSPSQHKYVALYQSKFVPHANSTTLHLNNGPSPQALILVPTRELAAQITTEIKKFTEPMYPLALPTKATTPHPATYINVVTCSGGQDLTFIINQINQTVRKYPSGSFSAGPVDILVATPGRLIEVLSHKGGSCLNLLNVGFLVLDEADRMIEIASAPLQEIFACMPSALRHDKSSKSTTQPVISSGVASSDASKAPEAESQQSTEAVQQETSEIVVSSTPIVSSTSSPSQPGSPAIYRQTVLFSATFPKSVQRLSRKFLHNPAQISISENKVSNNITQGFLPYNAEYFDRELYPNLDPTFFPIFSEREKPLAEFINSPFCDVNTQRLPPLPYPQELFHDTAFLPESAKTFVPPTYSCQTQPQRQLSFLLSLLRHWFFNALDIFTCKHYLSCLASFGLTLQPKRRDIPPGPTNPKFAHLGCIEYSAQCSEQAAKAAGIHIDGVVSESPHVVVDVSSTVNKLLRDVSRLPHRGKVIIFAETTAEVDLLYSWMHQSGFSCLAVHSNMAQQDRDEAFSAFKSLGCADLWQTLISEQDAQLQAVAVGKAAAVTTAGGETDSSSPATKHLGFRTFDQAMADYVAHIQQLRVTHNAHLMNIYQESLPQNATHSSSRHLVALPEPEEEQNSKYDVLITTNLLSRGMDVPALTLVINMSIPQSYQDYVHRVGRVGRGTNAGFAFTFLPYFRFQYVKPPGITQHEDCYKKLMVSVHQIVDQLIAENLSVNERLDKIEMLQQQSEEPLDHQHTTTTVSFERAVKTSTFKAQTLSQQQISLLSLPSILDASSGYVLLSKYVVLEFIHAHAEASRGVISLYNSRNGAAPAASKTLSLEFKKPATATSHNNPPSINSHDELPKRALPRDETATTTTPSSATSLGATTLASLRQSLLSLENKNTPTAPASSTIAPPPPPPPPMPAALSSNPQNALVSLDDNVSLLHQLNKPLVTRHIRPDLLQEQQPRSSKDFGIKFNLPVRKPGNLNFFINHFHPAVRQKLLLKKVQDDVQVRFNVRLQTMGSYIEPGSQMSTSAQPLHIVIEPYVTPGETLAQTAEKCLEYLQTTWEKEEQAEKQQRRLNLQ